MLATERKGKEDTVPETTQNCTMVVGGLLGLNSLREATTWMTDILAKLKGPTGQEMYILLIWCCRTFSIFRQA